MSKIFDAIKQLERERTAGMPGPADEAKWQELIAAAEEEKGRLAAELEAERERSATASSRLNGLTAAVAEIGEALRGRDRELAGLREEVEAERERFRAELQEANDRAEEMRAYLGEVEGELKRTKVDLDARRGASAAIQDRMREAERRTNLETRKNLERAEAELARAREESEMRRRAVAEMEATFRHLERKQADELAARDRTNESQRRQLEEERQRATTAKKAYEGELAALRQREASLAAQVRDLSGRSDAAAKAVLERDGQLRKLEERLASLEPKTNALLAERDSLRAANESLQSDLARRSQEADAQGSELAESNEAVRQLRARVTSLEGEIAAAEKALAHHQHARREVEQETSGLQAKVLSLEAALQASVDSRTAAEQNLQAERRDAGSNRERAATLEKLVRDLEQKLAERDAVAQATEQRGITAASRSEGEAARLQSQLTELGARYRDLEEQYGTLRRSAAAETKQAEEERERLLALIARRENEIAEAHEETAGQSERHDEAAARISELEIELAQQNKRCTLLESQVSAAGRILDRLRAEREELRSRLASKGPAASARPVASR